MTHLGLNSAVASAERGFETVCFDPDSDLVGSLAAGRPNIVEPRLNELMAKQIARLHYTSDSAKLAQCNVVYVAPDVPTDEKGASDLGPIMNLIGIANQAMADDAIMVVLSQVPPGFTRSLSRKKGVLFYQVETLIFGRAIERALEPERFMVGCADPVSPLPSFFRTYLEAFGCPILPMRYESAELAKISINMCLVASVTTANTLAELCECIGADWSEIVPALKLDRRIGQFSYLSPGLGISGGNLERDLATVVRYGDMYGSDVGLVRAYQANSRYRKLWALRKLHELVLADAKDPLITVLGLSYKEDTASVKNSPAVELVQNLWPYRISAYDPVVQANPKWHPNLSQSSSALDACAGADVVVLMTPWKEFRDMKPAEIARRLKGKTVIDPYGLLDPAICNGAGLQHCRLGVSSSDNE